MIEGDIKPVSDDEFKRAQRISDARARRELARKMRERPLEQIIDEFAAKVEPDPAAPYGRCEKCSEPFQASESGRLKDHVCASIVAAVTTHAGNATPAEKAAERSVERIALGIRRVRRDTGEDGE